MNEKDDKLNKGSFLYIGDQNKAEWGYPEGYPHKEMGEVALMEEYVLELSEQDGKILCGFPGTFFVPGSTYKITWDGTDYICTAEELQGTIVIGNLASLGGAGNNEPFAMMVGRESTTIIVLEGGVHGTTKTVSISEFTETIHPMASAFLPQATQTTYGSIKKATHIPHVTEAPTSNDFNKLLSALREAQIMSQSE